MARTFMQLPPVGGNLGRLHKEMIIDRGDQLLNPPRGIGARAERIFIPPWIINFIRGTKRGRFPFCPGALVQLLGGTLPDLLLCDH
jgi:hypothetical protein